MYGGWFGGRSSVMRGESSDYGKMPRFKGYGCERTKVRKEVFPGEGGDEVIKASVMLWVGVGGVGGRESI